jgi:hypothetical protein
MRSNVNAQLRLPAPVVTPESILAARAVIGEIYMDE